MSKNYFIILVLTILLATACNQNQKDLQESQYENLGNTSNPNTNFENMTNDTNQVPNTEPNTETPNDTPIQNDLSQTDNDVIDNNVTDNESIEQPENDLGTPAQEAFPLYMTDFQQRWNAISDEQTGDLYIHHLQQLPETGRFQASLKATLNLEVQSQDNKQINKISIISTSKTKGETLQMLTSWWQVLLITNPQSELHEIDTIFSGIGIGPNSNFEDLQAVSFSFGGLQYKVTPYRSGILFEAIYPNLSENPSLQGGT